MEERKVPPLLKKLADDCGGEITEVGGPLPDGSGFAIMSMPLRPDHWIYGADRHESYGKFNVPPMVFRMGRGERAVLIIGKSSDPNDARLDRSKGVTMTKEGFAEQVRLAGKYAVRCATMNGKEMDFDPDALLQNLVVGFLGYWTENGLSDDEWANSK
jgi:hypothetical protein